MNNYNKQEIEKHNNEKNLWIIIDNHVFDITSFVFEHPGGSEVLIKYGGKNATEVFNEIAGHNDFYTNGLLEKFCIGKLVTE